MCPLILQVQHMQPSPLAGLAASRTSQSAVHLSPAALHDHINALACGLHSDPSLTLICMPFDSAFSTARQMKRLYSALSQEEVVGPVLYETPEQAQAQERRVRPPPSCLSSS